MASATYPGVQINSPRKRRHLSCVPPGLMLMPECQVLFEEGTLDEHFEKCKNKCRHPNFIPVKDFDYLKHLPKHLQTESINRRIKRWCDLTVRVMIPYTSSWRPYFYDDDTTRPYPYAKYRGKRYPIRFGTGIVSPLKIPTTKNPGQCPCQLCKTCKNPQTGYWAFIVQTATHVIYDDEEAERSVFDLFFDSKNCPGVQKIYGVCIAEADRMPNSMYNTDIVDVKCVTHDCETATRLLSLFTYTVDGVLESRPYRIQPPEEVMISHPHGCSKHITVGSIHYITVPIQSPHFITGRPIPLPSGTICRLPKTPSKTPKLAKLFRFYVPIRNNIYTNILDIICDNVYTWFQIAASFHLFCCPIKEACLAMQVLLKLIIEQRWLSTISSENEAPDLIDIGFLLLLCALNILVDLTSSFPEVQQKCHDFEKAFVTGLVLNILKENPKWHPLFDLKLYVMERALQDGVDGEYGYADAVQMMVVIILRADTLLNEKGIKPHVADIELFDEETKYVEEPIRRFAKWVYSGLELSIEIKLYIDKKKSLPSPEIDEYIQPGTESELGPGWTFTLPASAEYAFRYYKGNPGTLMFPPGTRYQMTVSDSSNDTIDIPFPEEAEFITHKIFRVKDLNYFVTYDIDTCDGSSGAALSFTLPTFIGGTRHVHSYSIVNTNQKQSGLASRNDNNLEMEKLFTLHEIILESNDTVLPLQSYCL